MRKKILGATFMVAMMAVAGYNVYMSQTKSSMSDLSLVEVEALAQSVELPGVTITCSTGGEGYCYTEKLTEGLYGVCKYECIYTGNPEDYCSQAWIDFVNFCTMIGLSFGG